MAQVEYSQLDISQKVDITGWSPTLEYLIERGNPSVDSSYLTMDGATWFTDTYWNKWRWARKYTNNTGMTQKLNQATFQACSGHSNNKYFGTSVRASAPPVHGYGCTFYCDIYYEGVNSVFCQSDGHILPTIVNYNCSSPDGVGTTRTGINSGTKFGSVKYFGPNTALYTDTNGNIRSSHDILFNFSQEILIEPGQSIYFVVNVYNWAGTPGVIVIENIDANPDNWDAQLEPIETDYIWVMTEDPYTKVRAWKKERKAYLMTTSGWQEMK